MRSLPWLPTDAFSLEAALAQIPGEPFGFHRRKHRRAQIAETRTSRGSGFGYHAGSPSSQAFHFAQPWSCFYGRGSRESGAILLGGAGSRYQAPFEKTLSEEAQSWLLWGDLILAAQLTGGTGLLPSLQARAFAISFRTSSPMGSRLSHLSRCIEWKAKTLVGFIEPRSAYRGLSMRCL